MHTFHRYKKRTARQASKHVCFYCGRSVFPITLPPLSALSVPFLGGQGPVESWRGEICRHYLAFGVPTTGNVSNPRQEMFNGQVRSVR